MNWDDLRIFLAVTRERTVRAAGERLGMSHSTVIRRLERLEEDVDSKLFVRTARGLSRTQAGDMLRDHAIQVEAQMVSLRRAVEHDEGELRGDVRLTMPVSVMTHLFMADLARFSRQFPGLRLVVDPSDALRDLDRHEVDVALRFVAIGSSPPDRLVGRRLGPSVNTAYATPAYIKAHTFDGDAPTARWIGWSAAGAVPSWAPQSEFPTLPTGVILPDLFLQLEAAKEGLGVIHLPCAIGDTTPELRRVPGWEPVTLFDIWLLTHKDLRDSVRLRVFRDFVHQAMQSKLHLFAGRGVR